jgi:hypothetical protein
MPGDFPDSFRKGDARRRESQRGKERKFACKPHILEKGKPVARPGRKAEGLWLDESGGSLAAEGVLMAGSSEQFFTRGIVSTPRMNT